MATVLRDPGIMPTAGPGRPAPAGSPRTIAVVRVVLRLVVVATAAVIGYLILTLFAPAAQAAPAPVASGGGEVLGGPTRPGSLLAAVRDAVRPTAPVTPKAHITPKLPIEARAGARTDQRPESSLRVKDRADRVTRPSVKPGRGGTELVDPVTRPVAKVTRPVAKVAAPVAAVTAPVGDLAARIIKPVTPPVESIIAPVRRVIAPIEAITAPITRPVDRVLDPIVAPVAPDLPGVDPVPDAPPVDGVSPPVPVPVVPGGRDTASPSAPVAGPDVTGSPVTAARFVVPGDGRAGPAIGRPAGQAWSGDGVGSAAATLPSRPGQPTEPGHPDPWVLSQSQSSGSSSRAGGTDGPTAAPPGARCRITLLDAYGVVHPADDRGSGRSPGVLDLPG